MYLSLGMSGRVLEWGLYPVSTKTFDFSKAYLILKAPTIFSKADKNTRRNVKLKGEVSQYFVAR